MEEVVTSCNLMGIIFSCMDEEGVEDLMCLPSRGGVNIRTLSWAWRLGFDLCARKSITRFTYPLYASPHKSFISPGVRGSSVSVMHNVCRLEISVEEDLRRYRDFLDICSPEQFCGVRVLEFSGCIRKAMARPCISNIVLAATPHALSSSSSKEPTDPPHSSATHLCGVVGNDPSFYCGSTERGCMECIDLAKSKGSCQITIGDLSSTSWAGWGAVLSMFLARCGSASLKGISSASDVTEVCRKMPSLRKLTIHAAGEGEARGRRIDDDDGSEELHAVRGVTDLVLDCSSGGPLDVDMVRKLCSCGSRVEFVGHCLLVNPRLSTTLDMKVGTLPTSLTLSTLARLSAGMPLCDVRRVELVGNPMRSYTSSLCMPSVESLVVSSISVGEDAKPSSLCDHGEIYASLVTKCFPGCRSLELRMKTGQQAMREVDRKSMEEEGSERLVRTAEFQGIRGTKYFCQTYLDGRGYLLDTVGTLRNLDRGSLPILVDENLADFMRISLDLDPFDVWDPDTRVGCYRLGCREDSGVYLSSSPCCSMAPGLFVQTPDGKALHSVCLGCSGLLDSSVFMQ